MWDRSMQEPRRGATCIWGAGSPIEHWRAPFIPFACLPPSGRCSSALPQRQRQCWQGQQLNIERKHCCYRIVEVKAGAKLIELINEWAADWMLRPLHLLIVLQWALCWPMLMLKMMTRITTMWLIVMMIEGAALSQMMGELKSESFSRRCSLDCCRCFPSLIVVAVNQNWVFAWPCPKPLPIPANKGKSENWRELRNLQRRPDYHDE